jgi:hypothetical protein
MRHRTVTLIALAVTAAVALWSCTLDGTIYATIETEVKTFDNSLPNTVTVGDVVALAAGGPYYVAVGALYRGILTTSMEWTSMTTTPSEGGVSALVNALAYDGTNVWGGFVTAGGVLGLYSSPDPSATPFTAESSTVVSGKQVVTLSAVGGNLFAVCSTLSGGSWLYELDHHSGSTWTANLLSGLSDPIVGVAGDGSGNFFTAAGLNVYAAAGSPTATYAVSMTLPAGDSARGIFGDTANHRVFVTSKAGGLYYTTNAGTSWTHIAAPTVSSVTVSLLSVGGPADTGNDEYVVGSDGYGYYLLSLSGGTLTRFGDSTIALYTTSVRRVLVDGRNVLLGTNGAGLWRATFDTSGALSGTWTHE